MNVGSAEIFWSIAAFLPSIVSGIGNAWILSTVGFLKRHKDVSVVRAELVGESQSSPYVIAVIGHQCETTVCAMSPSSPSPDIAYSFSRYLKSSNVTSKKYLAQLKNPQKLSYPIHQ